MKRRGGEGGQGWEGKFRGSWGEGKGVGKKGGEGKFRGARPPQCFFPRTAPASGEIKNSHFLFGDTLISPKIIELKS